MEAVPTCTSGGIQRGNYLPWHAMTREAVLDSRQEILRTAARLFQQRGYDATSMNDVAAALKLSKGGLYHHFQSKDEILFEIMNHAMDLTQERVLAPVGSIADPEERLRALIRLHIEVVLSPRAAAFALLGMINWIYQWYKPEGNLQTNNLVPQFTEMVFGGILA